MFCYSGKRKGCSIFGVSLHDGGDIRDGGYVLEFLLKCCVQSVCIESVFHHEHYNRKMFGYIHAGLTLQS